MNKVSYAEFICIFFQIIVCHNVHVHCFPFVKTSPIFNTVTVDHDRTTLSEKLAFFYDLLYDNDDRS